MLSNLAEEVLETDGPASDSGVTRIAVADPSDEALVVSALAGKPEAQELIYRRHGPRLFALATRLLGSEDVAEDVLHDTFLRAFSKLNRLREPAKLRGWLSQILVNETRSTLRRDMLRKQVGLSAVVPDEAHLPDAGFELDGRMAWRDVSRLLGKLSAETRIVWWLKRVERNTVEEVAQLTQMTVDRVKKRLVLAEKKMVAYRRGSGSR